MDPRLEDTGNPIPELLGAYAGYKVLNASNKARELYNKLPGTTALQYQLARSQVAINTTAQSLDRAVLSQIMALEEASPLHILRTFQISNLLQPFIKIADYNQEIHISGQSIRGQQVFYESLLREQQKESKRKINRLLQSEDLKRGLIFKNNKLYGVDKNGKINLNDVVLHDARLVTATQRNGGVVSQNHVLRKYAEGLKAPLNLKNAINDPLMVVGSYKNNLGKQLNAYLKLGMEMGYKTLDNPIQGFEDIISGLGGDLSGLTRTSFWQKAKSLANIRLGTGGVYDLDHLQSLKLMTKNLVTKSAGAYIGYQGLDSLSRWLAPAGSDFDSGLLAGFGGMYADFRIGLAKVWSDRFQGYKERQEQSAPGSTDLLTLMGFPLGGALVGAQYSYFSRIGKTFKDGAPAAADKYSAENTSKLLQKIAGIDSPMTIMKRNSLIGAAIGGALTLPFLPGALIGASSKELEERYSGKKDTEIRANRWWLFGGNSIHGDHVKYSQKNWFQLAKSEGKTKAIYGDDETKKSLNPLLHPFSYLRDPYKFEKLTNDSMPYPVWGMEIGYGSFVGKIFERTIGQVIKPDVLNPEIAQAKKEHEARANKLKNTNDIFGLSIDKEIISFRNKNLGASYTPSTEDSFGEKTTRLFEYGEYNPALRNIVNQVAGLKNTDNTKVIDLSKYDINVEDADTIELKRKGLFGFLDKKVQVRLAGVDAPETSDHAAGSSPKDVFHQAQEYNKEATQTLKDMLARQSELKLIVNTKDQTYGRQLGVIVGDNNSNINMELLRQGAVTALPWDGGDIVSKSDLMAAQKEAQRNNKGLWQGKRYKAEQLFGELTGEVQTHNTFTSLQRLSENPVLGSLATYLKNIEGQRGSLTQEQVQDITMLANTFLNFKEGTSEQKQRSRDLGLEVRKNPTDGSTSAINTNLSFTPNVLPSLGYGNTGVKPVLPAPSFDPITQGSELAYQSLTDFVGIKGWAFSLAVDSLVNDTQRNKQLARSGEATNAARDFKDSNLGDVVGIGEFQRKIMGTSSGALPQTTNMLKNQMPSWLPSDGNRYYIDFSKGNPYSLVENGETRLPGKGFEALHPELKGLKPEEYPLIYQYKILSDVAKGSSEQYRMRRKLLDLYKEGSLSKKEEDILVDTLDKEVARDNKRRFRDTPDSNGGLFGMLQSTLWNNMITVSNSNPLEMLTPWRPFSKFVHQRTAIEDYEATQLGGSDTAIWTNPYSHFIKPALNKMRLLVDDTFKPDELIEKENVNEYFDKLSLLKGLLNSNEKEAYQTVVHSSLSGLNTKEKVLRFKAALTDDQKVYFNDFSKETGTEARKRILEMLPDDVAQGYQQIWRNLDLATKAKNAGQSVQKALMNDFIESTEKLKSSFGDIPLSNEEKQQINKTITKNRDDYANQGYSLSERRAMLEAEAYRTKVAQKEAYQYIEQATGTPSGFFAGWDPRLTVDDIKIKTLAIGGEDLRKFGFWKTDEERMNNISELNREEQVVTKLDAIKEEVKASRTTKEAIKHALFNKGFVATNVRINDSEINSVIVRNNNN